MAGSYAATALAAAGRCAPGFRAPAVDGPRPQRWAPPPTRFGAGRRLHAAVSSRHRRRVVAAASQNGGKFGLGANSELQVTVKPAGSAVEVELVATNAGGALALHWGALQQGRREWVLPARRPEGTKTVDDAALRTPFKSSGSSSTLKIEIDDPALQSIEFVLVDEAQNKWFKNNGENFLIHIRPGHQGQHSAPAATNQNFSSERVTRKNRDVMQLLSKHASSSTNVNKATEAAPHRNPTVLDLFLKSLQEKNGCQVLCKKVFKLGEKEILASMSEVQGKFKVHLATNHAEPLILHWALAKKAGEWKAPPPGVAPAGSTLLELACESSFSDAELDGLHYKVLEIELDADSYKGMPFVLRYNETWIKNNTSDFYLDFSRRTAKTSEKDSSDAGKGTAKALLETIADLEGEAQKSFMHRFNIASDLVEQAKDAGQLGLAGLLVWMRFMATRQLIWNKNYNVKPREISQAQDRFTDNLESLYRTYPQYREMLRMILAAVGRGGQGDVGQRIRDEILVIQRNNNCMGGMMEEWHQKLHNNTSPDDVVICQALMDYMNSDLDIKVYWDTLNKNGITKERLASYDHPIHSEPNLTREQKEGLLRDLTNYMRSLKAVHSGADLESAIGTCTGYTSESQGFMVGVEVNPVKGLPSGFSELLKFVLDHIEDKSVESLVEGLLEARAALRPLLLGSTDRLKDLIFLDIALDSTVRTAVERSYENLNNASPQKLMYFISLVVENLALSTDDNEDLLYCLKGWNHALEMSNKSDSQWALYAKAFLDRTRLALATKGEEYHNILQPSAEYLGSLLGIEQWTLNIFTEEIIRSGSAASLSLLLNRLDPVLRNVANLGSWQIISPVEVAGYVVAVDQLLTVQDKSYDKPTVLVVKGVKGEEEIPDGVVAVLTPDMPDVLSHVSVRARNSKVLFATCFDPNIFSELQQNEGKVLSLKPGSVDINYREIAENELVSSSPDTADGQSAPSLSLAKKQFLGKYAISADEFSDEKVGAKSRNIAYLNGKVPSWVSVPTSVALPFGTFETALSDNTNKEVAQKLQILTDKLNQGEFGALNEIRNVLLNLTAPTDLVKELKEKMQGSGMPWPGDEGEQRWEQAWMAIKKVWASKWNERAYFSTRKVKLDHANLCMSVLVQEVVSADYAFVIHTTNPSSGESSEIYAEVVKGLGETLVGAYPGRAMSFVCKKDNLDSPKVLGYPSKPIGLFIKKSVIFRSDSNGEDLEGYAGAGLYDSVPMDKEEEVVLDYTNDPLITDCSFRNTILSNIARTGHAIEELYGSPQDIEGVVKDGKIYVVQTRPQM
ncbi:alpha-glucan water dikinase, chloroplastic isoform X2 [Triticum aestivum]|uniref:alpha-glucan water dikinase, chloroplastic isoform X2 n=1 Tax=Triticum aestivum TaxID=4565 RepID=UPI001D006D2E|nr:alpha-glucan water dikinase, chloroplastic-like isoform X2 [Triticum aestivum]